MAWLIAIVALLLVISPVMWMMPSPLQRKQARLRARAMQRGLQVRVGDLPQTRRQRVREESARSGVCYRLLVPNRREPLLGDYLQCRERPGGTWESETERGLAPALRTVLDAVAEAVPADVVAIELTPLGAALWWTERGDERTVEQLAACLHDLVQAQLSVSD